MKRQHRENLAVVLLLAVLGVLGVLVGEFAKHHDGFAKAIILAAGFGIVAFVALKFGDRFISWMKGED